MTCFLSLILYPGWQTGVRLKLKICACRRHGLTGLGRHEMSNRIGGECADAVRWLHTFFKSRQILVCAYMNVYLKSKSCSPVQLPDV